MARGRHPCRERSIRACIGVRSVEDVRRQRAYLETLFLYPIWIVWVFKAWLENRLGEGCLLEAE